jgi:hypothetical protein
MNIDNALTILERLEKDMTHIPLDGDWQLTCFPQG